VIANGSLTTSSLAADARPHHSSGDFARDEMVWNIALGYDHQPAAAMAKPNTAHPCQNPTQSKRAIDPCGTKRRKERAHPDFLAFISTEERHP